jgi:hypothetical protein
MLQIDSNVKHRTLLFNSDKNVNNNASSTQYNYL